MLRSVLGATAVLLVSLSVSLSGALAAPAAAAHHTDPLAGVPYHPDWGSVAGQSGVLRHGCHTYQLSYTVTMPGDGIWVLEIFISGPGSKHVAAGAFLEGSDPTAGTGTYKLCMPTARYGTFQIDGKVSSDDGSGTITEGRVATNYYRLHRPHRHRHHH